jgi:hypothetical protein
MGGGGAAYRITIDGVDTAHRAEREPAPPGYWRLMQDGEREPVAITKTRRDCIARFADLFARDRRGAA